MHGQRESFVLPTYNYLFLNVKRLYNKRLSLLNGRHAGESVILVANGPSLNLMDLSFLKHNVTIGMNKIFLGFRKFHFYPRYYVAVNNKVISQSADEIKKINAVKFIGNRGNQGLLNEDALTYLINTQAPTARFCTDITECVHEGWTVTHAALQIAFYLGFSTVYIIGMDHHYTYSGSPNESQILTGEDPNHFSGEYFGHGQEWDNPDLKNSEESYRIAREIYERNGRRIIDATLNGACDVFEKQDYKVLFS